MQNIKSLYILGLPIDTEIGKLHFITVEQYYDLLRLSPILDLQKFEIVNVFSKIDEKLGKYVEDKDLVYIINNFSDIFDLKKSYKELFELCFKEDVFDKINNDEELFFYFKLIREMNCITKEEKNPNPEIQRFIELKKLYDQKKNGGGISIESMVTSIWVATGINPLNLTIYQLYALFNRVSQFKNFDTTILYNSVAGNVPIEHWYKHIDILDKAKEGTALDEYQHYANSLMSK